MSSKYTVVTNTATAIERHIGKSYTTILYVSKHLDKIEVLANAATSGAYDSVIDNVGDILIVSSNINGVAIVASKINEVEAVSQYLNEIETVALNAEYLVDAAYYAQNVVLALSSSEAAKVSEDNAKASEDISTQNAATTTSDKNTIAGYRSDVEADRVEVAANTNQVASDKAIVSGYRNDVEGYKNNALNAKTEAQRWATGVSGSGVNTPSDSNNAFYYSEVARNNANQTFKSGGYFTPTVGQEYPDVTSVEVDTIWLIKFASETGSFIYTTGDLAGETVKNGFMLVYDTPDDTFDYIPTTLSGVNSINGITPDATGNITIDADDVGALPYSDVNVQTAASYTLVLADAFKMVTMDNADANTLTVPPNSAVEFPTNTRIDIGQDGAGQTTIVAGTGVTIRTPESLKLRKQWSKATLIYRDVDVWDIVGDLEAEI